MNKNDGESQNQQLLEFINKLQQQLDQQNSEMKEQRNLTLNIRKHAKSSTETLHKARQVEIIPEITKMEQPKDIKEKLPQIDKFKGDRTMWDEWHLGAQQKLLRDGKALGSSFYQFMYIYLQLDGDAIKMISTTARTPSENGEGKGIVSGSLASSEDKGRNRTELGQM